MNIQIKIQTLLLLITASLQCMEPENLILNSRVIRKFIKVNTDNRFHIDGFSRQRDRIGLLQQLADQGAYITFSSKNTEIPSWLDKDINTAQHTLYKFFSFLRYNKNTDQVAVKYTRSEKRKKNTHILCCNNDTLSITTEKSLENKQEAVSPLLKQYEYNNETAHTAQPDPDQNSIDAWPRYLQAIKKEIDGIKAVKPTRSMGTILRDQGIFQLTGPLLSELMDISKKTPCTTSTHSRIRLKKLNILSQLVKEKIDITFNNENLTCLIKDTKIFKETFYSTFFLFLDYNNSDCQAATYNTSLSNRKGFMATISLNNSLLHMVSTKKLSTETGKKIGKFIDTYRGAQIEPIDRLLDIVKGEKPLPQATESPQPYFAEATKGRPIEQIEITPDIQDVPQKNLTIEGEIIKLNDFELGCIVVKHMQNSNVLQRLRTVSELHDIRKELTTFINDHI